MRTLARRLFTALVLAVALLGAAVPLMGCRPQASPSCELEDGVALDVSGRADGLYGVVERQVDAKQLATFDRMVGMGTGVDGSNGKPWVRFHLDEPEASAVRTFTSGPLPRGVAVVIGGEVASVHKVREAVTSSDQQVSCCNPHACERWNALLGGSGTVGH